MKKRIRILRAIMVIVMAALVLRLINIAKAVVEDPKPANSTAATESREMDEDKVTLEDFAITKTQPSTVSERLAAYEAAKAAEAEMIAADRAAEGLIVLEDGRVLYMTLDYIRDHLYFWYPEQDILESTLIIQAEDLIAFSDTIWAAHAWLIVDRVGCRGFVNNQSIHAVLSDTTQFPTWTAENLAAEPYEPIERIVRDVFARKIFEEMGAPPELVGRVLPSNIHFFNTDGISKYNRFYEYTWGGEYNPFDSPYNPYDN